MKFLTHDGLLYFWRKVKTYVDTKYNELFQSVSNGKKTVANAITDKGVSTSETATFATMATNINKIITGVETGDATAVASEILSGKTAYAKGSKLTGLMVNRGAVNQSLAINGTYTIPAGYHNGSGKVTQSITTKEAATITPGTTNQTIAAGQYLSGIQTIKGDANLIPANILSGKSIFGVNGTASESKIASGTATATSETVYVQHAWGGNSDTYYAVKVSGLTFKPKAILVVTTSANWKICSVYIEDFSNLLTYEVFIFDGSSTMAAMIRNDSDTYVNATGFSIPVEMGSLLYQWWAIG